MDPAQLDALCSSDFSDGTTGTMIPGAGGEGVLMLGEKPNQTHPRGGTTAIPTAVGGRMSVGEQRPFVPARMSSEPAEDSATYRRKLAAYQDGQQKQAQLIQKLQTKVLQYKKRTSDLELEVEQLKSELETSDKVLQTTTENLNSRIDASEARARALQQDRTHDVETTLTRLQEEQQRGQELTRANEVLRDQLEQAVQANQGLSQDVARLTLAWRHAAQQLDKRETEWREEESAFNDYFAAEHSRLLALWRAVVGLRRQFGDLRQQTEHDLSQARNDLGRFSRNIQSVCGNLEVNLRESQAQTQASLKRETKHVGLLEAEASERVRSLTESLARSQACLTETEGRLVDSNSARERLAIQLADRDRILNTLSQLRSSIYLDGSGGLRLGLGKKYSKRGKRHLNAESETSGEDEHEQDSDGMSMDDIGGVGGGGEDHLKATKLLIENTHMMHRALSQVAQLIISDSIIADADEAEEPILHSAAPKHEWPAGHESTRSMDRSRTPQTDDQRPFDKQKDKESTGDSVRRSRSASPHGRNAIVRRQPPPTSIGVEFRESVESDQLGHGGWYGISPGEIGQLRKLAHSKYRAGTSLHLAESVVAAIQTAFHRRAAHVHRLRYRTHGLEDQMQNLLRRGDEVDADRRRTQEQLTRLREEMESQGMEMDRLSREKDRIQHSLNLTVEERKLSETTRMTLSEQVHDFQAELERNRAIAHEVTRQRDELNSEREKLITEQERMRRELASVRQTLEGAEERAGDSREELAKIRELLRRTAIEKEVLDQEKADTTAAISRTQTHVKDLEQKLFQAHISETQLKDKLGHFEAMLDVQERDNKHLNQQTALAHSTELRLSEERASLRSEKHQLREEMDKLYSERGHMVTELEQSKEQVVRLEAMKNRLEAETSELSHERLALVEALNNAERQKTCLLDELNTLRRDTERQCGLSDRLSGERETLTKHKAELVVQLNTLERDNRAQSEHIAHLKEEKVTLETSLFEAQEIIDQLQCKQTAVEREIAELKLRRDTLQAELFRAHTNFQVELDKSHRSQQEMGNQLNTELEDLRNALTQAERRAKEAEEACLQAVVRADQAVQVMGRHQRLEAECTTDRESELHKSAEEVNRLTRALLSAQRERDETRLQAEQERQRALLRASDEKSSLQERVTLLQQTITELQTELERSHQDSNVQHDHDRSALRKTTEEVRTFRTQLEETCSHHERDVREQRIRIHDLENQRDQLIKETNELQLQARLAEESRDGNRAELVENSCRMRSVEEAVEAIRRECTELRQKLAEVEREKNALDSSNDELRRQLKTAEMERIELARMSNVARSQLQGTELERTTAERRVADLRDNMKEAATSAAESRREASESRSKLKKVTFEKDSLEQETAELRRQLQDTQTKEEVSRREKTTLKQRLLEMESTKAGLQSDVTSLARQLTELDEALRSRERATAQAADDWTLDYRRLDEAKSTLEAKIEQSNLIIGELRASLAETQAHLHGVEAELVDAMTNRQEAEARLSAIHSILRRLLGFRQAQYVGKLGSLDGLDVCRVPAASEYSATDGAPTDNIDEEEAWKSRRSTLQRDTGDMEPISAAATLAAMADGDGERALRRFAEKVLVDRMARSGRGGQHPVPSQRTRRGQVVYETTASTMQSPVVRRVRSSGMGQSRRSKSSSPPPRERIDGISVRPTSTERQRYDPDGAYRGDEGQPKRHPHSDFALEQCGYPVPINADGDLDRPPWSTAHWSNRSLRGLPGSDLDPEAVRLVIRDFLRHLVQIERDRDTNDMKARYSGEQISELKRQLSDSEQRTIQMQTSLGAMERGKLEIMEQLSAMRTSISEQEVLQLKREKDQDSLQEKLIQSEQQLGLCEAEKLQLQSRLDKVKSSERRLEEDRRQLLRALDDAETRFTEAEVSRRRLEGEVNRLKTIIADFEQEKQTLHSRLESMSRQIAELESKIHTHQGDSDHLSHELHQVNARASELKQDLENELETKTTLKQENTELKDRVNQLRLKESASEQERRLLQERLEACRTSLNETKSELHVTLDRLRSLQMESSDDALNRAELETQLRQLTNSSAEQQQTNTDLQARLTSIQSEFSTSTEKNAEFQRVLNDLDLAKHEMECELNRMRKEQAQMKKTIERMDRERSREQEVATKLESENKDFFQSIRRLEDENLDLRREHQKMQVLVTQQEDTQAARLIESNAKQRVEIELELDRQRTALAHAEKQLQAKERAHRHRIRGLEDQVTLLKDQLNREAGKRQLFISKSPGLTSQISPSQPNLLHLGSPTTTEGDTVDVRSRMDFSLPQDRYLSGSYKPTIAPSRYDPYFYQVTGSIPSQLDRPYGSGRLFPRSLATANTPTMGPTTPVAIPRKGGSFQSVIQATSSSTTDWEDARHSTLIDPTGAGYMPMGVELRQRGRARIPQTETYQLRPPQPGCNSVAPLNRCTSESTLRPSAADRREL